MGGLAPAHRKPNALLLTLRRRRDAIALALSLILAAGGLVLALTRPPDEVYADSRGVHMAGIVLMPRPAAGGLQLFAGVAAYAIRAAGPDQWRAAAVATVDGQAASGLCTMTGGPITTENCRFVMGSTVLSARDTFDASTHTWRRTYSDGRTTTFIVAARAFAIPIPLPLGR